MFWEKDTQTKKINTLQTLKYLCFSCSSVSQFKMSNNGCKSKKTNIDQPQILTSYRNLNILKMESRQKKEHLSVGLHSKTDWQKKGAVEQQASDEAERLLPRKLRQVWGNKLSNQEMFYRNLRSVRPVALLYSVPCCLTDFYCLNPLK